MPDGIQMSLNNSFGKAGILPDKPPGRRETGERKWQYRRVVHQLIEAERNRLQARRRLQKNRFDRAALKRSQAARIRDQHLNDAHIFVRPQSELFQNNARSKIGATAKLADADTFSLKLLDLGKI